jgi:hypothetical protein
MAGVPNYASSLTEILNLFSETTNHTCNYNMEGLFLTYPPTNVVFYLLIGNPNGHLQRILFNMLALPSLPCKLPKLYFLSKM